MTVLVTGATGLLGSHITELLLARGDRPRLLIRPGENAEAFTRAGADVRMGDITDARALDAAVRGVDRILHCAARTGPWGPETEYMRTNVDGLRTLLEVSLAAGVAHVVHVSSITVHGNDVRGTADESARIREEPNPYSRSKVRGERVVEEFVRHRNAPVTVVRPGWIYGPRDNANFGRFARLVQQGRMMVIGRGDNHIPLVYVTDVAEGILLASTRDRAIGRTYLLVHDEGVTQIAFLTAIAAELGVPPPRTHAPYRLAGLVAAAAEAGARLAGREQPPPLMRYGLQLWGGENRFDITRARIELGFSPRVDMAEGVRRSVEWFRAATGTPAVAWSDA
jgi:nucleoside-diphosphate-sugar epimerase